MSRPHRGCCGRHQDRQADPWRPSAKPAKTVTSTFETLADGVKTTTQTVTETLTDGTETQKQVITEVYDDVVDGALVTVEKIKTIAADGTVQVAETTKKSAADTFDGLWKELQTEADTGVLGTFDDLYTAVKNQDWLSIGKWVASTIYGGLTADQEKQVNDFALGIVTKLNKALGGAAISWCRELSTLAGRS